MDAFLIVGLMAMLGVKSRSLRILRSEGLARDKQVLIFGCNRPERMRHDLHTLLYCT